MRRTIATLALTAALVIAPTIPAAAQPTTIKTAWCYNQQGYHWEWPWCWNIGWGVPASCWYIKTVCY